VYLGELVPRAGAVCDDEFGVYEFCGPRPRVCDLGEDVLVGADVEDAADPRGKLRDGGGGGILAPVLAGVGDRGEGVESQRLGVRGDCTRTRCQKNSTCRRWLVAAEGVGGCLAFRAAVGRFPVGEGVAG
jgi:hypothetical protein